MKSFYFAQTFGPPSIRFRYQLQTNLMKHVKLFLYKKFPSPKNSWPQSRHTGEQQKNAQESVRERVRECQKERAKGKQRGEKKLTVQVVPAQKGGA